MEITSANSLLTAHLILKIREAGGISQACTHTGSPVPLEVWVETAVQRGNTFEQDSDQVSAKACFLRSTTMSGKCLFRTGWPEGATLDSTSDATRSTRNTYSSMWPGGTCTSAPVFPDASTWNGLEILPHGRNIRAWQRSQMTKRAHPTTPWLCSQLCVLDTPTTHLPTNSMTGTTLSSTGCTAM